MRAGARGQGTFSSYHFISTRSRSRVVCINKQPSETGNVRVESRERERERERGGGDIPYFDRSNDFHAFLFN